jgi:hypothetical protein
MHMEFHMKTGTYDTFLFRPIRGLINVEVGIFMSGFAQHYYM